MTEIDLTPYRPGLDWKTGYCTRDGRPVRILADDRKGYPTRIVALVNNNNGCELTQEYNTDGRYSTTRDHELDLMCMQVTKTIWVNVYPKIGYFTREDAGMDARYGRIACVPVTYTEGEGL